MSQPDTNRNLLFAIMAVQMDFVPRDAMFTAMVAWTERKETLLGQILVDRGELSPARRSALDVLIDEHVKAHANDPARSLQALSSTDGVAEILTRVPDAQLQASLGHLRDHGRTQIGSDSPADLATIVPSHVEPLAPWTGRFRVVRKHAEGGLGIVSVAIDDELDREVAFKEIKPRHADRRDSQARFVMEAEITGKLEHPGIVPIYGLGHDPMGRPYYAMRFIRGDSLADAINRFHDPNGPYSDPTKRALQLRELLARFLDVCDALSYAHSRGVLHRDLKPGNVMLGQFGETLVVDWGLALPLEEVPHGVESTHGPLKTSRADSGSLPSERGVVIGTPQYMSPEQAEGAIDQLGPRSDVYGLGAILYDLLTGRHPVQGEIEPEVLDAVRRGRIRLPRQVCPEVPPALEAICLKALSLRPEDRYPDPRSLAGDVKSWLADEPVTAYREPALDRARRWAKRNRVVFTGLTASLLVGLIGLGAVVAVQAKARHDLAAANQILDRQRRLAEANLDDATEAIKKYRDAIAAERLLGRDEFKDLRSRLLNEPIAFFRSLRERLLAEDDTRPEALARLAAAASELGYSTEEIGDRRDALVAYREALRISERLVARHPDVAAYRAELADTQNNIGSLLSALGKPEESRVAYEAARDIRRRLAEDHPDDASNRSHLAEIHSNLGILLRLRGEPEQARAAFEAAGDTFRRLVAGEPAAVGYRARLAESQINLGALLSDSGKPAEARAACEAARDTFRQLTDENPEVPQYQNHLAFTQYNLGRVLSDSGKPEEAIESYNAARDIFRRLADTNPAVAEYRERLAGCQQEIGNRLMDVGKPAEARAAHEGARDIRKRLVAENPELPGHASDLAGSLHNIARIDRNAKRFAEARRLVSEAIGWQRKAMAADPANPRYRQLMKVHLSVLIEACQGQNDGDGVADARRELQALDRSDPALIALDRRLASVLKGEARLGDNAERLALAQRAYDRSLHAGAARLWAEALESDQKLAGDRRAGQRYNAAGAAALAGTGQGKDEPATAQHEKARLRGKALDWLRAELQSWEKELDSGKAKEKETVGKTFLHWTQDSDLAGVREAAGLAKLPEGERKEWEALWREVERLRAKAK